MSAIRRTIARASSSECPCSLTQSTMGLDCGSISSWSSCSQLGQTPDGSLRRIRINPSRPEGECRGYPSLHHRHDRREGRIGAANVLGVARPTLSRILNGHAAISPEMAIRLEKAGWSNAEFWLRRQASCHLTRAREKDQIVGNCR